MNNNYPKDCSARKIASRGTQIVHYVFDANRWIYREKTGNDYGIDAELEYSNNDLFKNEKFECQIKATQQVNYLKDEKIITYPFPVKTLNYAINSLIPFFFLLVDVKNEEVYFIQLKKEMLDGKDANQQTINLHIPICNNIREEENLIIDAICKK